MVNWIYSNPTWLWGTLLVVAVTAVSCLGLTITHRLVNVELRRKHNDVTAAAMGIVGIAYAVLLAFIAVATWENFASADKIVDTEASSIGDLYRETIGLPQDKAVAVRADIKKYLEQVMSEEWTSQRGGHVSLAGRPTLVHLHSLIATIGPTTPGETAIAAELLRTMNSLYDARRTRILAARGAIPEVVWWIIAFGTALTIGFTYLFGTQDLRMHLAITGMVAASMSLVIVLIISLDRPFRGDLSVSVEAYENARGSIAGVDSR
jgi:hypothetical protein